MYAAGFGGLELRSEKDGPTARAPRPGRGLAAVLGMAAPYPQADLLAIFSAVGRRTPLLLGG